ncbi:MAG TPA: hypothetical protein VFR28_10145 [Allosphingosinicella sp.]|jgi:hypothetical protein|nr:hypothetical protein [Allosphingosinicella sp.]
MRGYAGLAATGMLLVLVSPATARDRIGQVGEARSFDAVAADSRNGSVVPQTVSLDPRGLLPPHDPSAPRLFGSLPVAENVALGVGLFSVIGTTEKEQMRRRQDPSREYRGSDTRVAAVGMSLRF